MKQNAERSNFWRNWVIIVFIFQSTCKIFVFVFISMTGQCAVRHALNRGLKVKLLIRTEATVPEDFKEKVELIKGDVLNVDDCKKVIQGSDAVCVVLGTRNDLKATTDLSNGTKNIIAAMKEAGLKKISVCLSAFLFYEPEKVPKMFTELNADHQRQFDIVKGSGLEYR